MKKQTLRALVVAVVALALAAPLAFYAATFVPSGPAWGEWGTDELREKVRYAPAGLERLESFWKAPLPDYDVPRGDESVPRKGLAYLLSALLGTALTAGAVFLLGRALVKKR